ncbi:concanavalin A-like lectin/glucanase [Acephala macrosclerotiorum]|nr:concanavalin A-like lectin/glucanase [Acephala macrosclerotiorum]
MKFTQGVAFPLLFSTATLAAPTKTHKERSTEICGRWDSLVTGTYTIYQDLWGEVNATSGSQCTTINSETNGMAVWSTSWTWAGGSHNVKSYANLALTATGVQLSSISSIPAIWKWSYTGTSIVADVSWDIFTSPTATASHEFEIMVWLAALGGAGPISSTGSAVGNTTINGVFFDLYSGPNGDTTVYSFVANDEVTDFDGDLLDFFTYLEEKEGFSSSQYITALGAGTEPFTGTDAIFSVSAYSVSISTGTNHVVSSTTSSTTTAATVVATTKATSYSSSGTIAKYYQCGGTGWTGSGSCVSGTTCTKQSAYYSQCL